MAIAQPLPRTAMEEPSGGGAIKECGRSKERYKIGEGRGVVQGGQIRRKEEEGSRGGQAGGFGRRGCDAGRATRAAPR
ncbi:hypothetical protein NL676_029490 [Syzygium grande]|nr:hypothetical protein NL676_029490 [Syzygium grande]